MIMVVIMDLVKTIKERSGMSITKLAEFYKVSRQSVYEALNGAGSRNLRVELAHIIGKKPSCVYEYTDKKTALLDDFEFDERFGDSK